ncbi:MAG: hypothetical protein M0C28_45825, partial [Candidatus Moduliflexus flocculans]|nr:hypothetical protein [Candidatus Moduliflexus flocculans]
GPGKALKDGQEKLFALKSQAARVESDIERETKRVEYLRGDEEAGRDRPRRASRGRPPPDP